MKYAAFLAFLFLAGCASDSTASRNFRSQVSEVDLSVSGTGTPDGGSPVTGAAVAQFKLRPPAGFAK